VCRKNFHRKASVHLRQNLIATLKGKPDAELEMSKIVFGTKANPIHGAEPYHEIARETGDVWLVDSRLQPHQVDYGRRLMATGFEVDAASMQDPTKSLDHRVRAYHAVHGSATSPAALQAEVGRGAGATT